MIVEDLWACKAITYLLGLSNAETSGLILSNDDLVITTEEHELVTGDLDSSGGEVGPAGSDRGDLLNNGVKSRGSK